LRSISVVVDVVSLKPLAVASGPRRLDLYDPGGPFVFSRFEHVGVPDLLGKRSALLSTDDGSSQAMRMSKDPTTDKALVVLCDYIKHDSTCDFTISDGPAVA
jgi:hypothetical protein